MIILFAGEGTWVARLLSRRGFVGIGLISYSAYLWHQPLFAFARLRSIKAPDHLLMAVLALAALLLAWATWYWIEQAFRKGPNPLLKTQRSVFLASGAVAAVFVAIGFVGQVGNGFEGRGIGSVTFVEIDTRLEVNPGLHWDCEKGFNVSENCRSSDEPDLLLWGDSFAMHLAQGIAASAKSTSFAQQTVSQCSPIIGLAQVSGWIDGRSADYCMDFNDQVMRYVKSEGFETVVMSSPFGEVLDGKLKLRGGEIVQEENFKIVQNALIKTVEAVRATGAKVIIVSPTPSSGWDNGQCLMRSLFFKSEEGLCDFTPDMSLRNFKLLRMIEDDVAIYWLNNDFCQNGRCDVMQNGVFIYRDAGHLSKEGSAYLGETHDWVTNFERLAN